jgi:hypothetical protein
MATEFWFQASPDPQPSALVLGNHWLPLNPLPGGGFDVYAAWRMDFVGQLAWLRSAATLGPAGPADPKPVVAGGVLPRAVLAGRPGERPPWWVWRFATALARLFTGRTDAEERPDLVQVHGAPIAAPPHPEVVPFGSVRIDSREHRWLKSLFDPVDPGDYIWIAEGPGISFGALHLAFALAELAGVRETPVQDVVDGLLRLADRVKIPAGATAERLVALLNVAFVAGIGFGIGRLSEAGLEALVASGAAGVRMDEIKRQRAAIAGLVAWPKPVTDGRVWWLGETGPVWAAEERSAKGMVVSYLAGHDGRPRELAEDPTEAGPAGGLAWLPLLVGQLRDGHPATFGGAIVLKPAGIGPDEYERLSGLVGQLTDRLDVTVEMPRSLDPDTARSGRVAAGLPVPPAVEQVRGKLFEAGRYEWAPDQPMLGINLTNC